MKMDETTTDAVQQVAEEQIMGEIFQKNLERTDLDKLLEKSNVEKEKIPPIALVLTTQLIGKCDLLDLVEGLEEYPELREEFIRVACRISEKYEVENHHQ